MEDLENHIRLHRPTIKDSTIKSYKSKWKKINALATQAWSDWSDEPIPTFLEIIQKHPARVVARILEKYSEGSAKAYIAAINGLCSVGESVHERSAREGFETAYNRYRWEIARIGENQKAQNGQPSEKQKGKWADYAALKKCQKQYFNYLKRNKLSQKYIKSKAAPGCFYLTPEQYNNLLDYIITSLYLDIEPRRNIYRTCRVIKEQKDFPTPNSDNWLIVKSRNRKYFQFNDQKNGGKTRIPAENYLPSSLNSALNLWMCVTGATIDVPFDDGHSNLLFPRGNWKGFKPEIYQQTAFTKKVMRAFKPAGEKLGTQMIRSIIATHKDGPKKQIIQQLQGELAESAAAMGHSVNVHTESYVLKI